MFVLHLALGGCLKAPPVRFGITADTGGHVAYVLDAALAQASHAGVSAVSVVTRRFRDARLDPTHDRATERLGPQLTISRVASARQGYLEKEELAAELPSFTENFLAHLGALPRLPDVIHAHFADAAGVALAARARFGIPVIYTPHALGLDKRGCAVGGAGRGESLPEAEGHRGDVLVKNGPTGESFGKTGAEKDAQGDDGLDARIEAERRAIAGADAVVVSTRDEALRQVAAYGAAAPGAVHTLAPGVPHRAEAADTAFTLAARLGEWLNDPRKPIVLAIARPVRKKNLAALVRAFAATPALRARANLVILAGQHDGAHAAPEEAAVIGELQVLCADPRLRGRVALPPRHEAGDVLALYRLAAAQGGVFVNPALHEPFGLTLIEAAAAGLPVVATRHGGPAEILGALEHGVLVDPRDEVAIGTACLQIVADAALHRQFALAARRNIDAFSWHRYAEASVALYAALAQARSCRDGLLPVRPATRERTTGERHPARSIPTGPVPDRSTPALLACDIDNTLTGCAAGAAAFRRWHAGRPIPFIVATGRAFAQARAVLQEWDLPEPDAFITDVGTRLMVRAENGDWRPCQHFAALLDEGWHREAVAAALAPLPVAPQPADTAGPHKLSFFGNVADAALIRGTLAEAGLAARVVHSHDRLIDVLAPRGGKAAAVAGVAARLGLSLGHCVAAGDSGNDLDMLGACGRAIVVGNASAELDALVPRPGLYRAVAHHAGGVLEGLAQLGLAEAGGRFTAPAGLSAFPAATQRSFAALPTQPATVTAAPPLPESVAA